MFFTISFNDQSNGMLRLDKGGDDPEDHSDKNRQVMHVLETGVESAMPFSIGRTGEGEHHRHCIIEGLHASVNEWVFWLTFYAFKTEEPGTIPFAVARTKYGDGIKYKLVENATNAGGNEWIHDFVFYAYPGTSESTMLISVGSHEDVSWNVSKLAPGVSARDDLFEHVAVFKTFAKKHAGTVPISVERRDGGKRYVIMRGTHAVIPRKLWPKDFIFYGLTRRKPGTIAVSVGQKSDVWRGDSSRIWMDEIKTEDACWKMDFAFYVHPFDCSILFQIAVGYESQYWCYMIRPGSGELKEGYFQHEFTFYGFRAPYPGTVPISIGTAGAEHNRTLRSRVEFGYNAGNKGWEQTTTLYVLAEKEPGTVPIAVGHADFVLGGWKYRVCENCINAGTKGWTHDFVFYAYPYQS